jgi:hypothetical protein
VFEPRSVTPGSVAYDPIGGMQDPVAELTVAVVFGLVFASLAGRDDGTQFFTGYVVEKSLPVKLTVRYAGRWRR